MNDYQERVKQEFADLKEKIIKLRDFITSPPYDRLPSEEAVRLARQLTAMTQYLQILDERIAAFPAPTPDAWKRVQRLELVCTDAREFIESISVSPSHEGAMHRQMLLQRLDSELKGSK